MSEPAVIEVFADVTCPFTHVGIHRWIERRRERGRADVALRVRAWPLELVNGAPLDRDVVAAKVADLRAQVAPGLFAGFDPAMFPTTTLPALRLTDDAYRRDLATGERVAVELRDLLFERGRDVADEQLLDEIADHHGVVRSGCGGDDPVRLDLEEGRRRGVIGSPHFFGPGFDSFCPGLLIDHEGADLRIALSGRRFDEFDDRSFGQGTS